MNQPDLTSDNKRQQFLTDLDKAIDTKLYPECDVSITEDLLVAIFTRDKAEQNGHTDYANKINKRIQTILDIPQTVIDATENDNDPTQNGDKEIMAFLFATQVWREALGAFEQLNDGKIMHGGDYANGVINADDLDNAKENLHNFRAILYDIVQNVDKTQNNIPDGLTEPDASIENILVYHGMLMTIHRRELGDEITDTEMRTP